MSAILLLVACLGAVSIAAALVLGACLNYGGAAFDETEAPDAR